MSCLQGGSENLLMDDECDVLEEKNIQALINQIQRSTWRIINGNKLHIYVYGWFVKQIERDTMSTARLRCGCEGHTKKYSTKSRHVET